MNRCDQARQMFGAYWDDEVTQAEREWLDAHLTGCTGCRSQYDQFARTLELAGSLARVETASDLPERALAAARRAEPAPDRIVVPAARPAWVPVAAAAALLIVGALVILPRVLPNGAADTSLANRDAKVVQPRLVASAEPATGSPAPSAARTMDTNAIFDHSEDVEFILDPVVLHRGRAQAVSNLPEGVQGEQTVISF
ncbi:MAG: zf-HC2 domain-containing protein [Candidatus Eisenbacteria bacterium]|nr:zf-HC2 domain-containing protein [Candidatus Eisenbacteria bacterium]